MSRTLTFVETKLTKRVQVQPGPWRRLHPPPNVIDVDERRAPLAQIEAVPVTVRARLHPSLVVVTQPASPQAASFRVLRHRIAERGAPRVVLVTSAQDGEGKSVAAANLALALAEGDRARVLLVDAHARRPRQATLFGVDPLAGFFEQLVCNGTRGEGPWMVAALDVFGLHVLGAGPPQDDAPVDVPAFRAAMASMRERYDHVVVDAPAVLTGPDVSLLEDAVDAVVIVARAGTATARTLRRAVDHIAPTRLLGTLLVDV